MEQRLKERIFGAMIVTALFVIFLPMIFKEPSESIETPIPAPPEMEQRIEVPQNLAIWEAAKETETQSRFAQAQTPQWAVRLATFANQGNANKLVRKLKAQGYTAFLQEVPSQSHTLTSVLIGPHEEKASAQALQKTLEAKFKLKGLVVPLDNHSSAG